MVTSSVDTQLVSDIEDLTLQMRRFAEARDWSRFQTRSP